MNYCEIKFTDVANGPGVRVSLFVSGCRHRCEGCFNPETWDFSYGQPFTEQTEQAILEALAPDYIQGLTLLGGDPLEPENRRALLPFLKRVRALYPNKDIWCFTGDTLEKLWKEKETTEFLQEIDVLVDGPFVLARRNLMLKFRGSDNQRLLDIPHSFAAGKAVEWEETK